MNTRTPNSPRSASDHKTVVEPIGHHSAILECERETGSEFVLPVDHEGLVALANPDDQILIAIVFEAVAGIRAQVFQRAFIAARRFAVQLSPASGRIDPAGAPRDHHCALSYVAGEYSEPAPVKHLAGHAEARGEPQIRIAAHAVRVHGTSQGSSRGIARNAEQSRVVTAHARR